MMYSYKVASECLLACLQMYNDLCVLIKCLYSLSLTHSLTHLQHLLELHNFCTLMSILNGLAHPSITRLKKSFTKLDKSANKRLESLQALARPGENFKLLRDELKKANNPCIPYLYVSNELHHSSGYSNVWPWQFFVSVGVFTCPI